MATNDPTTVTYTVKELLSRIDQKLDGLASRLESKADIGHVDAIERRVAVLEADRATSKAVGKSRSWIVNKTGVVFTGTISAGIGIAGLVYAFTH